MLLPKGVQLTKKETYELAHPSGVYDLELFTDEAGKCWAIAVPKNDTKFIVYGSPVMDNPQDAIQVVISKIHRETGYSSFEADFCGEPVMDEEEEQLDEIELVEDEP